MSDYIHPELITTILSRLPVKSLLRFRTVSKEWCSIIDSEEITKLHLHHSRNTASSWSLIAYCSGQLFSVSFSTLEKANEIINPFESSGVINSCNGVLLLRALESWTSRKMALFNPSTRRHKILPNPHLPGLDHLRVPDYEAIGIGFDSVHNDLKVLDVVEFLDHVNKSWVCQTHIYSLKLNSWKMIKNFPYNLPCKRMIAVHVNNCLHVVVNTSLESTWPKEIVAVDLATEDYHVIQLPANINDGNLVRVILDKIGDCLCLHCIYKGFRYVIWVMKEYGVAQSWTVLLSVEPPAIDPHTTLVTIGYSEGGDKLLFNYSRKKLVWYEFERKRISSVSIDGFPEDFQVELCIESLVRLDDGEDENPEVQEVRNDNDAERDLAGESGTQFEVVTS